MSDDLVKQAIIELQDLVRCRCHPAYKDRNLHDPDCHCEDADNVALVVARIEELEAKLDTMVAALAYEGRRTDAAEAKLAKAVEALSNVVEEYDLFRKDEYERGMSPLDDEIHDARTTLAELKGDNNGQ
jgi:hypothetical protein